MAKKRSHLAIQVGEQSPAILEPGFFLRGLGCALGLRFGVSQRITTPGPNAHPGPPMENPLGDQFLKAREKSFQGPKIFGKTFVVANKRFGCLC